MRRRKPQLRDLVDKKGQRYIERFKNIADDFGNILTDCVRDCTFFRRGDCYLKDYLGDEIHCNHICYWQRVNKDGYLMDRDGGTEFGLRIDEDRGIIDKEGKPIGYTNRKGEFKQYKV